MSANTGSALPIKQESLTSFRQKATEFLTSVTHEPKKDLAMMRAEGTPQKPDQLRLMDSRAGSTPARAMSIFGVARTVSGGDALLDEDVTAVLNMVRRGLMLGLYLGSQYEQFSGLSTLKQRGVISDAEKQEASTKYATHAAVVLYSASRYIMWSLASYKPDVVSGTHADFAGLPEQIPLINFVRAISGSVYHWGSYLGEAQSGLVFAKITKLYFAAVFDEIVRRSGELKYPEAFTSQIYTLEGTDFIVKGFAADLPGSVPATVEFKRVEINEIVGNHEMKRKLNQLGQTVIAYDFERKMNPMMDFEAFTWLGVLQGWAGTGKSMGLSLLQTMVQDHCKALDIPFQLRPIPNAIVQSLQGESARVYEDWWRTIFNPDFICVAPVDDSEAVYLDRRSHSSSEGSKLVVMSHLRLTEGSTAFNYGNVLQPHATNNADMIDPPVFSRYQYRILVPGAQTRNDYNDQMKLWGNRLNKKAGSNIIDLEFPSDYRFLSDQGLTPKEERKVEAFAGFKNKELARLWEDIESRKLSHTSYDLYGSFFEALHKRFEQFTSRDVRNVTMNVAARLFGFDFPQEWLLDRNVFVAKNYDDKKKMILDAALQFQQGLTVEQVLFQEMVHYVETTIQMLDSGRQYRIRQMADEIAERKAALALVEQESRASVA